MSTAERRLAGPRLLPPLMLTAAEVADRLRVHPHTVRRWCREGRLRIEVDGRPSVTVYVALRPADLPIIADLLLRAAGAPDALAHAARSLYFAARDARTRAAREGSGA